MTLLEALIDGIVDIRSHFGRTFMQLLGVMLGAASMIAVFSLVAGGRQRAINFFEEFGGLRKILIFGKPVDVPSPHAVQLANRGLTVADAEAVRAGSKLLEQVDPISGDFLAVRREGAAEKNRDISGVTPAYQAVYSFYPARGRFLAEEDIRSQARVCVLGDTACKQIFGNEDPVGKTLYIDGAGFQVVGVMRRKEFYFGNERHNALEWMNRQIFVPITSLVVRLGGDHYEKARYLNAMVDKAENNAKAVEEIRRVLKRRHRGVEDFEVLNRSERLRRQAEQMQIYNITFLACGAISLLVGGIVITNILLASFQERVREVGLRKALGAAWPQILAQFMVESVLLSLLGGVSGVLAGAVLAGWMADLIGQPAVVTAGGVMLSLGLCAGVGIFFGLYPAVKAARLDPVEALRYE